VKNFLYVYEFIIVLTGIIGFYQPRENAEAKMIKIFCGAR